MRPHRRIGRSDTASTGRSHRTPASGMSMSKTLFEQHFGVSPQGLVSAPGRVNLIGEFTDYNDGWVLPCALEFRCHVAWRRREDNTVTVVSREYTN